jgi:hypothetical protein
MQWYSDGVITLESALFYCSNPTEFQLNVQGIAGSSDRTFEGFQKKGAMDTTKTGSAPGLGAKRPPAAKPAPGAGPAGGAGGGAAGGDAGLSGLSRDPFQR